MGIKRAIESAYLAIQYEVKLWQTVAMFFLRGSTVAPPPLGMEEKSTTSRQPRQGSLWARRVAPPPLGMEEESTTGREPRQGSLCAISDRWGKKSGPVICLLQKCSEEPVNLGTSSRVAQAQPKDSTNCDDSMGVPLVTVLYFVTE